MIRNKHSVINDVHVNAVLNKIFDRIIDNKDLIDERGNLLTDQKRREMIAVFKRSIGLSNY